MSQDKKTIHEEDALENALAPIVNKLIDQNFENSGDKIASQMAPLIGGAIREQIKSQKDDIVDALYPVMGNMISKFVTKSLEELLNKINEQIQNGLSIKAIKRKIKAKIKGVSETELLLEENSEAKIKAVLLIHKESGSLLCKVENENTGLSDADMLASMMSAIRSFVNEWISANEDNQELGEIEYGGNKIIIEASGHSYLAVIVEGAAYAKTYERIRSTLENIVLEYAQDIKDFQGNFKTLPVESLKQKLQKLLTNTEEKAQEKQKRSPLLFLLPLLFIAYLSYVFYQNYQDNRLKQTVLEKIENTPQLLPFKFNITIKNNVATIEGNVPFSYHKELIQQQLSKIKEIRKINNEIKIIPTLTDPMQVSANIAYLLKGVNLDVGTNINYNFDYNRVILHGITTSSKKKEQIVQVLKKIQGLKEIDDKINVITPNITNITAQLYFDKGSTALNPVTKKGLKKIIAKIQEKQIHAPIKLSAYSDMIGETKANHALAQKRLQSITEFLIKNGLTNKIKIEIFNRPPPGVDPQKDPQKARQISLTLVRQQ